MYVKVGVSYIEENRFWGFEVTSRKIVEGKNAKYAALIKQNEGKNSFVLKK